MDHFFVSLREVVRKCIIGYSSLNIIRSAEEQGCASLEHCNMCAIVSSFFHKHMWCLLCRTSIFPLCFATSIPCAQTVEASPCVPWAVITYCQLFVKVNVYVWFIAQSLLPFAASNNFIWEVSMSYT